MADGFCSFLPSNTKKEKIKEEIVESDQKFVITCIKSKSKTASKSKPKVIPEEKKPRFEADSCNILHIDSKIKSILLSKVSSINDLHQDLSIMTWIVKNGATIDRFAAKKQASILRRRIQDLEFGMEYGYYIIRTQQLIDEYKKIEENSAEQTFMSFAPRQTDPNNDRKNNIIMEYMRIAREYIEIDNIRQKVRKMACPTNDCSCRDFVYEDDESSYACKECGAVVELVDETPSFKDTDRINMSSRYRYSLPGRFVDTMKKYQGKQNKTISGRTIETIKQEMTRHDISNDEFTKDHLYMFLSDNGLSNHYEDINLIHSKITLIPSPDISKLENLLLEDFMILEDAYMRVKDPDRTNSMNVWYKLYKLLRRRGYKCHRDDFYCLKTASKEDEHDEKMKEAFDILQWVWIPT